MRDTMTTATNQTYGATYQLDENDELVITNVFVVPEDWDGYRFAGYCRPTEEEIRTMVMTAVFPVTKEIRTAGFKVS